MQSLIAVYSSSKVRTLVFITKAIMVPGSEGKDFWNKKALILNSKISASPTLGIWSIKINNYKMKRIRVVTPSR